MPKEDLLGFLAHQGGANYISDLRKEEFHISLTYAIEGVESMAYTVGEWNDALDYLTGIKKPVKSPQEGKKALLEAL